MSGTSCTEDIDLSWRLMKGGYGTTILLALPSCITRGKHQKRFVELRAGVLPRHTIFARTHFSGRGGRAMHRVIQLAIYLRAALAIAAYQVCGASGVEWLMSWAGWCFLQQYGAWQHIRYDWDMALPATGAYAFVWLVRSNCKAVTINRGVGTPWRKLSLERLCCWPPMACFRNRCVSPGLLVWGRVCAGVIAGVRAIFTHSAEVPVGHARRLYISGPADLMPCKT